MANKVEKVMCGASDLGIACGGALALGGVVRNSDLQSNATQGGSRKMNNMKKLMFGIAAIAAGVAVADVTSANVVGYQNLQMNDANYTMAAPTFIGVGDANGQFCMNDIKVTPKAGTKAPSINALGRSTGGILAGQFVVQFLLNTGSAETEFTWVWYAEGTQTEYVQKTKWQIMDKTTSKWRDCTTEELAFKRDAGVAMWIMGAGHSLTPAGAVYEEEVEFPTSTENYTAIGNSSPVDLTIGHLTVTPKDGTKAPSINALGRSTGGILAGQFVVQFLLDNGSAETEYTWVWYAEGTQTEYVQKTKWQIMDKTTSKWRDCTADELKFPVPAGKGMWVAGQGHTLNIPGVEL